MKIKSDEEANEALAEELGGLRGSMLAAAEGREMPARFSAEPHGERPAMIITDSETGRQTMVPLFAYGDVRRTLTELFGGEVGGASHE